MSVDNTFLRCPRLPRGAAAPFAATARFGLNHGRKLDGVPLLGACPLTRLGDGTLGAVCKLARHYRGAR